MAKVTAQVLRPVCTIHRQLPVGISAIYGARAIFRGGSSNNRDAFPASSRKGLSALPMAAGMAAAAVVEEEAAEVVVAEVVAAQIPRLLRPRLRLGPSRRC